MRTTAHHISLALLIAVLIGHASVAVHAATHISGDTTDCDLCISYGNATETLSEQQDNDVRPVHDTHVLPRECEALAPPLPTSVHQRGPPPVH